jgi:hypothetical protein
MHRGVVGSARGRRWGGSRATWGLREGGMEEWLVRREVHKQVIFRTRRLTAAAENVPTLSLGLQFLENEHSMKLCLSCHLGSGCKT